VIDLSEDAKSCVLELSDVGRGVVEVEKGIALVPGRVVEDEVVVPNGEGPLGDVSNSGRASIHCGVHIDGPESENGSTAQITEVVPTDQVSDSIPRLLDSAGHGVGGERDWHVGLGCWDVARGFEVACNGEEWFLINKGWDVMLDHRVLAPGAWKIEALPF